MRFGIFSDVHANIEALTAVLTAYKNEAIDHYLCAGDVVGYGANPNECVDIVRGLTDSVVVGNHDAAVAGLMDYSYYYEAARKVLDAHKSALTADNMQWLMNLPYSRRFDNHDITLCHGSPIDEEEFDYIFLPEQAYALLPFYDSLSHVTFIGHSHLCRVFELSNTTVHEIANKTFTLAPDKKYVISVGSVGQPRDYDNRASYTIFDSETQTFYFKRVEYDIEAAAAKIFKLGLERNFGNRLFIGV
ncbi:MAG: metallophosphoesterase family protein [Deltaproteobacteria bacterium]|nr:metallophosphoesterase family protein [Deltaproteobacteria bacterium]MBN2672267.1 metallophosphoesterase family protein [Deltaproteobacteria bacterium]